MKRVQAELVRHGLDCAIFLNGEKPDPNCFYLTGYSGAGFLIVPAVGEPFLHVPSRDKEMAETATGNIDNGGTRDVCNQPGAPRLGRRRQPSTGTAAVYGSDYCFV